jgi:hypothetical protein
VEELDKQERRCLKINWFSISLFSLIK